MDTRFFSYSQELRIAKLLDGKVNSNSGATRFSKGDVRTKNILIECKTSTKPIKSFSIKKEWLQKLEQEKFAMNLPYSMIAFDFGDEEDYFIIDKKLAFKLKNYLEKENE